ncbi:outer membrane beta-barrel family protein [Hymenobacter sp. H14-R3]|uniref:outer membrane beta-barrel family protein n=1 Tax=Hymenobacter sp. H14-R3 TaxID=3046308 RepID=UPI0024BAD42D|nr:outer membrane beta-barrel family protein [Hymenobacter sp. H14-R3]MDJ0365350.1 outer membrane beta-barrel family protein [Hymenobacter sp. H14-R3]
MKHVANPAAWLGRLSGRLVAARQLWGLVLLVAGLLPGPLAAQALGGVSGTLLDQGTRQPLPFASVLLLRLPDSTWVANAQTAENGSFTLVNVKPGRYLLRAEALGYRPARRLTTLAVATPVVRLGEWLVAPAAVQLGGVVVQGEKEMLVDDLDKKVINVAKDLNSAGGTAAEVLQKVPSVAVDENGQVSLRGSTGVTLYLDGKPAPSSLRLDQLPASRLETIEVITNPGARYSAQGAGGIINLVQKKQTEAGWNGAALATVGTRNKYSASLNLSRKVGKFNFFGSTDGLNNQFRGSSALQQVATADGRTTGTDQTGRTTRHQANEALRLGLDYAWRPGQTLTLTTEIYKNDLHQTSDFTTLLTRGTDPIIRLQNQNLEADNLYTARVSGNYRHTWAAYPGRELTASATYTLDGGTVTTEQRVLDGPASYARQARRQLLEVTIHLPSAQVDYVHPLDEKRRWGAGLKTDIMVTPGTADYAVQPVAGAEFIRQERGSYRYHYQQVIPQAYGSYQHKAGPWDYQAGLRAEFTGLQARVVPTGSASQRIFNVFPSATVARTLPHEQRIQLSYSRRLNRPNFLQIIALPIYSDARNYVVGNPGLRPEYVHAGELGHQVAWQATTLSTTVFGRFASQALQSLRTIDTLATRLSGQPDFITRTSYANLGRTASYGLELSLTQPLTKWWKLIANGSFYRNQVASYAGEGTRANFTGTAYLLNTFSPTKALAVQLSGNYRAPLVVPQGRLLAVYGVDVALRQRLLRDRAALTLRVSDVFNTRRQYTQLGAAGLSADLQTKYETRVGYLGFTWFLGANKPAGAIDNQPNGDTGGFGG